MVCHTTLSPPTATVVLLFAGTLDSYIAIGPNSVNYLIGGPKDVGDVDIIAKGLQQARELIGNDNIPHFVTEWGATWEYTGGAGMS